MIYVTESESFPKMIYLRGGESSASDLPMSGLTNVYERKYLKRYKKLF